MNQNREREQREIEEAFAADPAARKLRDLVVTYATKKGGLILAFLRLFHGPYWGEPEAVSFEEISQRLSVRVSKLEQMYEEMMNEVRPAWMATPEYRHWKEGRSR